MSRLSLLCAQMGCASNRAITVKALRDFCETEQHCVKTVGEKLKLEKQQQVFREIHS